MAGKLFLSVLLLLLLLLVGAFPHPTSSQSIENATIEQEEYAVYSAMLVDYVFMRPKTIVIANPTSTFARVTKLTDFRFIFLNQAREPVLSQETLDDFLQRNKSNRWLTPKFEISRKYALVDFREIKKLANDFQMDNEWKAFSKAYPESYGFVTLSRVGFNRQMDQALVYAGWQCPGLCGHWSFQLLAKEDGLWKVVGDANRLIS